MNLTPRGRVLVGIALALYFFANQTQIGWLYLMAALAAGLGLISLFVPRRMARALGLTRRINGSPNPTELELHVGHPLQIDLDFHNSAGFPALQLRGEETCPPALPADRVQPFFIPSIPARSTVTLTYTTTCARRGWFDFPPVPLGTRAPFGLVVARRALPVPSSLLVFPAYRELTHLSLFDRQPAPQNTFERLGLGGEFVGVREYRPGDSRRHVHWRSTARVGQLIVKEFAEETQPGLTLALDLRAASALGSEDNNSLELAIQLAASLARYAERRGLPVALAANSRQWPAPSGPLTWWALMNYLARVQPSGDDSFAACLRSLRATGYVAVLLPAPDPSVLEPLAHLRHLGLGVLALIVDPTQFLPAEPGGANQAQALVTTLKMNGIEARLIDNRPDWESLLED